MPRYWDLRTNSFLEKHYNIHTNMRIKNTLFLLIMAAMASPCASQTPAAPVSPNVARVHAQIPNDAVACLSVRLQQIKADQTLRLFPWEIISAASLDEVGIDLSELERFDLVIGPIADPPGIAGILTGKSKLDLSRLNPEHFKADPSGRSFGIIGEPSLRDFKIVPLTDNQVSVGNFDTLPPFLNSKRGTGDLQKQLQRLGETGHVSLVFVPEPIRPLLLQSIQSLPPELLSDVKVLVEKLQLVAARAQVDMKPTINVLIEAANEPDAQAFETSWNRLVETMVPVLMSNLSRPVPNEEIGQSLEAYQIRASKELTQLLRPNRKGARLLLTIDQRAINLTRGLTTFANLSQMVRSGGGMPMQSPKTLQDINKLKILGLACHNYHDIYKSFPGGAAQEQQNRKLSWRVSLLPLLGENDLYNQFKLDEPWDSDNNAKLLEKMPDVYRYSKANTQPGYTVFQMPLGPGLISQPKKKIGIRDITDGTSNSIMIGLSTDEAAVPWTKPDDFNPLENLQLFRNDKGQTFFVIADGSVMEKSEIVPEELNRMLTIGAAD